MSKSYSNYRSKISHLPRIKNSLEKLRTTRSNEVEVEDASGEERYKVLKEDYKEYVSTAHDDAYAEERLAAVVGLADESLYRDMANWLAVQMPTTYITSVRETLVRELVEDEQLALFHPAHVQNKEGAVGGTEVANASSGYVHIRADYEGVAGEFEDSDEVDGVCTCLTHGYETSRVKIWPANYNHRLIETRCGWNEEIMLLLAEYILEVKGDFNEFPAMEKYLAGTLLLTFDDNLLRDEMRTLHNHPYPYQYILDVIGTVTTVATTTTEEAVELDHDLHGIRQTEEELCGLGEFKSSTAIVITKDTDAYIAVDDDYYYHAGLDFVIRRTLRATGLPTDFIINGADSIVLDSGKTFIAEYGGDSGQTILRDIAVDDTYIWALMEHGQVFCFDKVTGEYVDVRGLNFTIGEEDEDGYDNEYKGLGVVGNLLYSVRRINYDGNWGRTLNITTGESSGDIDYNMNGSDYLEALAVKESGLYLLTYYDYDDCAW